jgi:glycosyltransferase involved in cell wall biosynthesis
VLGRLPRPVRPLEAFLLWIIRGCAAVVAMGEKGRQALISHGVAPERVHAIPPSIDAERFRPSSNGRRPDYDVVTVGDLLEVKRTHDLLAAVAQLRRSRPGIKLAVVGTGPLESELVARARTLGIADSVDFLGYREDVETVLARSGVFALSSRSEGLSVALCEAMACGVPAVVSDVGELRDLVHDGRNGFVVAPADVDALADRLGRLLADPDLRATLGRAAAADAHAYAGVERISSIYRDVLAVG